MGSAVGKVFSRKPAKIEFMESTKMPNAKEVDTRRRNSLMFFMRDWQELTTFEQQEASMVQVCRMEGEPGNILPRYLTQLSIGVVDQGKPRVFRLAGTRELAWHGHSS